MQKLIVRQMVCNILAVCLTHAYFLVLYNKNMSIFADVCIFFVPLQSKYR